MALYAVMRFNLRDELTPKEQLIWQTGSVPMTAKKIAAKLSARTGSVEKLFETDDIELARECISNHPETYIQYTQEGINKYVEEQYG